MDLALNDLQWLICDKTKPKPNQTLDVAYCHTLFRVYVCVGGVLNFLQGIQTAYSNSHKENSRCADFFDMLHTVLSNTYLNSVKIGLIHLDFGIRLYDISTSPMA